MFLQPPPSVEWLRTRGLARVDSGAVKFVLAQRRLATGECSAEAEVNYQQSRHSNAKQLEVTNHGKRATAKVIRKRTGGDVE